ncbi:putative Phytocyanin domain, cupredoxin [Helianthus debilis subsp. tardiflorus]
MAGFKLDPMAVMIIMVACMRFHVTLAGEVITVGGPLGWNVPKNPKDYTLWSGKQKFLTTDVLWFTGKDSVAEVKEKAYYSCDIKNPVRLITSGPDRITLLTPGSHFFICTKLDHCKLGQKFVANVSPS